MQGLRDKAIAKGYDGVVAVRVSTPTIVEGSAAVLVYGTGFNFASDKA